ncbi:MAG: metallophosphoesterase, partial [Thermoplasmata archaeon]
LEEAYLIYSKTQTALDNLSWTCVSNAIQQSTTQGYYAINASGNTTLSEGRYVYHAIINDLQPDTGYYFRIILPNSTSRILRARTLPNAGNATLNHPLEFIRAGDSQKYEKQIAVVWDAMSRFASVKDLYFILFTGDFTDDGDIVENWDVFFTLAEPVLSRMCLVPVLGNHEDNSTNYYTMLPHSGNGRFFSFRGGKCLIAVVDTSESFSEGSEQYVWLLSELENAREDYIFLATHRPPVASWLSSKDRQATADLLPIIDRYCVDLVMAGHKHLYERTLPYRNGSVSDTGTVYVISGGAGAKLDSIEKADFSAYLTNNYNFVHVLVDCGQVTSTGISISLVPFDSITINRVHGWRENADDKTGGTPVLRVYIYYFAAVLLLVISASTIAYAWSTREH